MKISITHEAWKKEAVSRYGADPATWAFRCPVCKHVATVAEWRAAGASDGEVAFSCIGRHATKPKSGFSLRRGAKGPCDYTGGGLFRLNPVTVTFLKEDGEPGEMQTFDFATDPLAGEAATKRPRRKTA